MAGVRFARDATAWMNRPVGVGTVRLMSGNRWLQLLGENPGHSAWYVERFRAMAANGDDLDGEARLVDAVVPRRARILDAGCGPGRTGSRLSELGHEVVGVDIDPALIEAAETDHPGPTWLVADLAELDLAAHGLPTEYDAIVCAGNVIAFLDPATRTRVLERLRAHLAADGLLVVGFGAGRGYDFDDFEQDAEAAGLRMAWKMGTWDLRPFTESSDFLVAALQR